MNPTEPTPEPEPESDAEQTPAKDRTAAVASLFREHNRKLVGLLVTRLRNEQEAKDVAQEAYVKLLQLDSELGTISYLRAYLYRIAENLAIDRLRQRRTRSKLDCLESGEDFFDERHAERTVIAEQELAILKRAVAELPDTCRQAFCLHKLADRPLEEVGALMGLKERMVRRHVRRAIVYICLRCEGHSAADSWKVMR